MTCLQASAIIVRMEMRKIIAETDTTAGQVFDLVSQVLVVISLVSFSLETMPSTSPTVRGWLKWVESITVILFTVEYLLRIFAAPKKMTFVFSFFGLIDLLAILPFYLSLGIDLRSVRIVRMLRVFRVLKIARYGEAIQRFRQAFAIIKEELVLFGTTTCVLLYLAAVGIYYFEHDTQPEVFASIPQSLWWAIVTMTTVGYGDAYPVTAGGRIFTGFVLLTGLAIIAVPAGLISSALSTVRASENKPKAPPQ